MVFLIAVIVSLTLIYGYVGFRIIQPAGLDRKWKMALWGGVAFFYCVPPFYIFLRSSLADGLAAMGFAWFTYLSFGFFTIAFSVLVARDLLLLVIRAPRCVTGIANRFIHRPGKAVPIAPSRRLFLVNSSNMAMVGVAGALTGYGLAQVKKIPEVKSVDIPLKNLPPQFNGFRILQLTDLHVSMTIRRNYVQGVVERANQQNPDMIVFTGDLADGGVPTLGSEAFPLADLEASHGKFFVTGNHDYYSGVDGWLAEVRNWGFVPLLNEHRIIHLDGEEIVLAGVTDYRAASIKPSHATDPKAALATAPEKAVKIMLAHQPKSLFGAETAGADLLICGHTHGGQYVPFNFMVPLDQPYVHGLHKHNSTWIYVSRGVGYWGPPIRVGVPSEITMLRLVCTIET